MIVMNRLTHPSLLAVASLALLTTGCGEDDHHDHDHDNENEVITTVTLTFTPTGGGTDLVFEFDDPDGDGGEAPTVDTIDLLGADYDVSVSFTNGLVSPPEDITAEIEDENDEHQIFFTGSAVNGPAADNAGAALTHAYADQDGDGNPIGLANTITAAAGTGDLVVTLRHLPPVGDAPAKTSTLADDVKSGGFGAIGGSSDVQVTFPVTVQ